MHRKSGVSMLLSQLWLHSLGEHLWKILIFSHKTGQFLLKTRLVLRNAIIFNAQGPMAWFEQFVNVFSREKFYYYISNQTSVSEHLKYQSTEFVFQFEILKSVVIVTRTGQYGHFNKCYIYIRNIHNPHCINVSTLDWYWWLGIDFSGVAICYLNHNFPLDSTKH